MEYLFALMALIALILAIVGLSKIGVLRDELMALRNMVQRERRSPVEPADRETSRDQEPADEPVTPQPPPLPAQPPPLPAWWIKGKTKAPPIVESKEEAPAVPRLAPPPIHSNGGFFSRAAKREGGWETFLGKKVLNKLGVVILVLGVIFLVGYYVHTSGKLTKLAAGALAGGGLIGLGLFLGRKEMFRNFVQPLIGGGWAILYFTAYASYHIGAVKVIDNQMAAMGLLMAVAAGMIVHSLKYRSQLLTTFAYILAYAAIWINNIDFNSLLAIVPLALSLVVLQIRFKWETLPLAGQLLSYGLYGAWMARHGSDIGSLGTEGPLFTVSLLLLSAKWFIYQFPLYFRGVVDNSRYGGQVINALAATVLFGLQLHRVHPGSIHLLLFMTAVIHAAHAILQWRRGNALLYRSYITATAVVVAVGLGYLLKETDLAWGWLLEAEALFFLGFFSREASFKHLAAAVMLCSLGCTALISRQQTTFFGRMTTAALPLHAAYGVAGYLHALSIVFFNRERSTSVLDGKYMTAYSWFGSAFLALAIRNGLDTAAVPVALGLMAIVLVEIGIRRPFGHLAIQGMLLAPVAAIHVIFANLDAVMVVGGLSMQIVLFLVVGFFLWYLFFRLDDRRASDIVFPGGFYRGVVSVYAWVGMAFFVWPIWLKLGPGARPIGWAVLALAALIIGERERKAVLRIQALGVILLALFGCVREGVVASDPDLLSADGEWFAILLVAAVLWTMTFVAKKRIDSSDEENDASKTFRKVSSMVYAFCAAGLVGFLFWVELSKYYLTVAWAAEGFLLVLFGILLRQALLRYPGLSIMILCIGKIAILDLSGLEMPYRILSFIGLGLVLIASSYLYIRFHGKIERILPGENEGA